MNRLFKLAAATVPVLLASACSAPTNTSMGNLAGSATASVECAQLASGFAPPGTRITATESVPAGLVVPGMAQAYPMPAHCKVSGLINERSGADGKPYALGFEMRLPVDWNGCFLFQTNSGNDGVVSPAFGNVVASGATTNALMQGFAVLSAS